MHSTRLLRRRRARAAVAVALIGLLAGGLGPVIASTGEPAPASRRLDGRIDDWVGDSTLIGGTSQYSRGEFVYQDHIYDDLGPDTGQRAQQHGTVGAPKGDYRYPTDLERFANNAADLLELRVAADATDLWVLARLNTLRADDTTVVALALDLDANLSTGGGAWPHQAGLSVPGADAVITAWGTGATLTRLPSGEPVAIPGVAVDTSNDSNAIEIRVPLAQLGAPEAIGMWAATGLWNGAAGTWLASTTSPTATQPGGASPRVAARAFNIAFRDHETGSFMEEKQAAALAAGDISGFRADIDLGLLLRGATVPYQLTPGRFYAVILDQDITIAPLHEGVVYGGVPGRFGGVGGAALSQSFSFLGRHQPYGVYLPSTYDGTAPLPTALVLHGLGGSHSSYNTQPGFLADMGEGNGTGLPPLQLVTPLGRGSSFYADYGEADALASLADVLHRFPVDEERLYITGYSMGGYGTYRLASLYPDRFAAAASWAGYTGEFTGSYLTDPRALLGDPTGVYDPTAEALRPYLEPAGIGGGRRGKSSIGNPVDTVENLRHLPLIQLTGTNDEIVPTPGQYAAVRRMAELGLRSRFDLYPGYEHFSFALVDDWKEVRAWLGDQRRSTSPRQVTYKFSDGWTAPGLADELGLRHDGAWWLSGLTMRDTTEDALLLATADAQSWGIAAPAITASQTSATSATPTPHVHRTVEWTAGAPLAITNRVDLSFEGVGTATIDAARAGLTPCGLTLSVATDGPVSVRLVGPTHNKLRATGMGATVVSSKKNATTVVTIPGAASGLVTLTCPPLGGQR